MKRRLAVTTIGTGVLALSLIAGGAAATERAATTPSPTCTASPDGSRPGAQARTGAPNGSSARNGADQGSGTAARGGGPAGQNPGRGPAASAGTHDQTAYASGELTDAQRADLVFMVQEEKLARDLYAALGAEYGVRPFTQITTAEQRHLDAVRTLLDTYGIDDPTVGLAAGEFVDAGLTAMYDKLLAQGMTSIDEAMAAGRAVEIDDISALDKAADGVTAEDVQHVYAQLLAGSEKHLVAFGG